MERLYPQDWCFHCFPNLPRQLKEGVDYFPKVENPKLRKVANEQLRVLRQRWDKTGQLYGAWRMVLFCLGKGLTEQSAETDQYRKQAQSYRDHVASIIGDKNATILGMALCQNDVDCSEESS